MNHQKIALIMGVANKRSIAWHCVESFVRQGWRVILTCQNEKTLSNAQPLLNAHGTSIMGAMECDVLKDFDLLSNVSNSTQSPSSTDSTLFKQRLADILLDEPLSAVVHSLAHAPNLKTTPLLQTTREDFLAAHEVSAYSLIEVARQTSPFFGSTSPKDDSNAMGSITALSYLGAVRAIPGYNVMGPAKASLESIVRGLALEMAPTIRVNAVSSGPLPTISAKGGIAHFDQMQRDVRDKAPLGNITANQVASTIHFLSTDDASGITGQTLYVDGGYSIVSGPAIQQ